MVKERERENVNYDLFLIPMTWTQFDHKAAWTLSLSQIGLNSTDECFVAIVYIINPKYLNGYSSNSNRNSNSNNNSNSHQLFEAFMQKIQNLCYTIGLQYEAYTCFKLLMNTLIERLNSNRRRSGNSVLLSCSYRKHSCELVFHLNLDPRRWNDITSSFWLESTWINVYTTKCKSDYCREYNSMWKRENFAQFLMKKTANRLRNALQLRCFNK